MLSPVISYNHPALRSTDLVDDQPAHLQQPLGKAKPLRQGGLVCGAAAPGQAKTMMQRIAVEHVGRHCLECCCLEVNASLPTEDLLKKFFA